MRMDGREALTQHKTMSSPLQMLLSMLVFFLHWCNEFLRAHAIFDLLASCLSGHHTRYSLVSSACRVNTLIYPPSLATLCCPLFLWVWLGNLHGWTPAVLVMWEFPIRQHHALWAQWDPVSGGIYSVLSLITAHCGGCLLTLLRNSPVS